MSQRLSDLDPSRTLKDKDNVTVHHGDIDQGLRVELSVTGGPNSESSRSVISRVLEKTRLEWVLHSQEDLVEIRPNVSHS